jgi:hypothetical protein
MNMYSMYICTCCIVRFYSAIVRFCNQIKACLFCYFFALNIVCTINKMHIYKLITLTNGSNLKIIH